MNGNKNWTGATDKGKVVPMTEASLRLEVTDLLLGRSGGVRIDRLSKGPTLEQGVVLERIEAALRAYGSYFYPPEYR